LIVEISSHGVNGNVHPWSSRCWLGLYQDDSSNTYISELNTLFPPIGRVVSVASTFEMSTIVRTQAHRYVLFNCPQVQPYIE